MPKWAYRNVRGDRDGSETGPAARGHVQGVHEPRAHPHPEPPAGGGDLRRGPRGGAPPGPADRLQAPDRDARPGRPHVAKGGLDGVLPRGEPQGPEGVRPDPRGPCRELAGGSPRGGRGPYAMMGMGSRPRLRWVVLAVAGASALAIVVALATGASAFMTSVIGPGWWLMPLVMIVVMTLVMGRPMPAMIPHGGVGMHRADKPENPIAIAARRHAAGEDSRGEKPGGRAGPE